MKLYKSIIYPDWLHKNKWGGWALDREKYWEASSLINTGYYVNIKFGIQRINAVLFSSLYFVRYRSLHTMNVTWNHLNKPEVCIQKSNSSHKISYHF